jgi:uncharacterized protein (DUF2147 family)
VRRLSLIAIAGLILTGGPAVAANGAEGVWVTPDDSMRIRIAPGHARPDRLCGFVVSIKPRPPGQPAPKAKDGRPARSPQSLIGHMLMTDFRPDGPGKWKDGKFQIPGMEKPINANMSLNKDGSLRVKGCMMLVCGGQNWTPA